MVAKKKTTKKTAKKTAEANGNDSVDARFSRDPAQSLPRAALQLNQFAAKIENIGVRAEKLGDKVSLKKATRARKKLTEAVQIMA
jgi:hypothetical protein